MKSTSRRITALMLCLLMTLGLFGPMNTLNAHASEMGGVARYSEDANDAYLTLTREMEGKLDDDKTYEFIIEIYDTETPVYRQSDEMTVQTYSRAVREGREESLVEKRINEQNEVLSDIFGERNIRSVANEISYSAMSKSSSFRARNNSRPILRNSDQLKTMPRYKALLNGFALKMTYAEAKEVAKLPNVKAVTKAVEYNMPVKPNMATSKNIINANVSTEKGYNGKGRIVAILDTGADVNHPDFRLSEEGLKAAKYTQESINEKISELHLWGEYKTEKIPYAYNYADRSNDLLDKADHGQHIAGTIAGNALDPTNGVVGVVPEAQLMVMRVFSIGQPTTNTAIYAEAIDDAVLLGADSINMSLGSFAGSEDADKIMTKVVKNANEHGTIVCIAGGNDGYQFSQNGYQPKDILDFATVGSPATMKESLAVASYNNSKITYKRGLFNFGGKELNTAIGDYTKAQPQNGLEAKEYDLILVGKGTEADYENKNVKGKIVIAERGNGSFGEKSAMAAQHGAAACIIGYLANPNQNYDQLYFLTVENEAPVVPTYSVSNKDYVEIKKQLVNEEGKITFVKHDMSGYDSPVRNTMSDFNSWGPTPGLGIKPEITAPGGDIWSTANNGGYQSMSGTSMATPHVAAGIAAVRGKLAEMNNLGLNNTDIAMFVKKVLMNTAKPAKTLSGNSYFSVRSQGSGIMDLKDATSGNYVTIEDNKVDSKSYGEAKLELGQIDDAKLNINVKLTSYLEKDVTYDVSYVLQTDKVEDDQVILEPSIYDAIKLKEEELGTVTVKAKGNEEFTKELTWEDDNLANDYPKGYFVDGYLFFTPQDKDVPTISIPMLAFKGEWDNLPVFEDFIHTYNFSDEKQRPLWLKGVKEDEIYKTGAEQIDATMLTSNFINIYNNKSFIDALGRSEDGKFTNNLAISPGIKDKSQDSFQFKGVFLRNWDDFYIEIIGDNNKLIKKIENPYRKSGRKTGYTVNGTKIFSVSEAPWVWDGTDADGNQVPEGGYTVRVHTKRQNNSSATAYEKEAIVKVDNTKPAIDDEPKYDDANKTITLKAFDRLSGIKAVYYIYETGDENNPIAFEWTDKVTDNSYTIENCEKDGGIVFVVDWAGNVVKIDLSEKGNNQLVIERETENGLEDPKTEIAVFDKDHKKMTNLNALEAGTYTIEALNLSEGIKAEINPEEVKFEEGKEEEKTVKVKFSKISQDELDQYGTIKARVIDSNAFAGGFTVYAIDENGKKFELYSKFDWGSEVYGAKVPAGKYTILVLSSDGKEINFAGAREVTVSKQDISWTSIRFFRSGDLQVYLWSEVQELIDKIKSLGEKTQDDNEYKFNAKNVFKAYDPETGKDLFEGTDYYEAYFKPWDDGSGFDFFIPADGNYTVELINDNREYLVEPARVDAKLFTYKQGEEGKWVGINVYYPKAKTANITVVEELVSGETSTEKINAKYHLYDDYNNEIPTTTSTTWENIQAKFYTLVVENLSEKLVPERKVYKIDAFNNLNVEQVVRYKDLTTDTVERSTSVLVGIYGDYPVSTREFKLKFKNLNKAEEKEIVVTPGTTTDQILPLGQYEVTIELPDDTVIDDIFLSVNNYENSKEELVHLGTKFNVAFTSAFNEIEINLRRQKRDFGEVNVKEIGLDQGQAKYELVLDGEVKYTSNDGIFRNVEPGTYKLKTTTPNGYTVDNAEKEVTVKAKEVTEVELTFTKDLINARKVRVNVKALEVNDYDDFLREIDAVKYEAIDKDGNSYELDQVPADIQVKIVEKQDTLKAGYERVVKSEGYRVFTEDKNEITIKYVNRNVILVDPQSQETRQGYVKLTFNATEHGTLNAPGIENVQTIAYLVKENYAMNDFDFYIPKVKANENYEFKSWKPEVEVKEGTYVAQYEYHEPFVPQPPTPTPDPDHGGDHYEPYRPERPYRPHRPSVDKTEEKKEEPIVTPKEEKKDYGIVDTKELLPVVLSDIPNTDSGTAIRSLLSRGILAGMGNGKFQGELPITRAMVAAVLMRISVDKNIYTESSFTDVKHGDWYNEAVKWAADKGLVVGYTDGSFKPNKLLTRQELAVIVQKFLVVHGIKMPEVKSWTYKDTDKIPAWSREAVVAMAKISLVDGQTDTMYNPTSEFTREELAVMLYKIIRWVETH